MKLMSYNVRFGAANDGEHCWEFRRELLYSTVRQFDPDLLGLQEALDNQASDILGHCPGYAMEGVAREDGKKVGEYNSVLYRTSRYEKLDGGTFWLSQTPEKPSKSWDSCLPRVCTWVRLRDRSTRRQILYANTHFDHAGLVARCESAKLLRQRLPALAEGAPLVISGDFNCHETDEPYKILVDPVAAGPVLLRDSYRVLHPQRSGEEATWHGFQGTATGSRIDWILYSAPLQPTSAEIVRTRGADGRYPSDHFPITAVFQGM